MADRKISDLTALTTPASGDYLPIVDISEAAAASKNKRITVQSLFQGIPVNVGIGTSSPAATLDIFGNQLFSAANPQIQFNAGGPIIRVPSANTIAFLTDSTTERLRIDSSGNVGIGTPNPSALLDLRGSTSTRINLGVTGAANRAFLDYTESGFLTTLDADGDIRFSPNNTEAVRITTAGNVGIGTSSPTTLLDVNADTVRVRTARTPASATATGDAGEICWDANYIYVCTATNTWKRAALSTW